MNLNPNLSYNVRVSKRRLNKVRFVSVLILFILCTLAAVYFINSDIKDSVVGIFTSAPDSKHTSDGASGKTLTDKAGNPSPKTPSEPEAQKDKGLGISANNKQEEPKVKVDYSVLKNNISNYIRQFQGKYGIYFIDLKNSGEFGINDLDVFVAASTVKVPINLYLYKKIEEGKVNPDSIMVYNKSIDYEGGTGYIQSKRNGTKYSVRELSKLSITVSDNIATNMLIRLLGKANYKNFMRSSGGLVVTDKNVSCPKDMATYMKKVYEFSKSNKELGNELINFFETTVFNDRLPKLLPKEVKVAHKIGNYWGESWGIAYHDVGIVFSEGDYVLAIMSKNIKSEAEGCDVIANISKKVYDYVNSAKK